jgi:hypothetical protein
LRDGEPSPNTQFILKKLILIKEVVSDVTLENKLETTFLLKSIFLFKRGGWGTINRPPCISAQEIIVMVDSRIPTSATDKQSMPRDNPPYNPRGFI